jgi:hypothetical protein
MHASIVTARKEFNRIGARLTVGTLRLFAGGGK